MSAEVVPGEGLSKLPPLGTLFYNFTKTVKEMSYSIKIAYSSNSYLETPILVTLPDIGARFTFSPTGHQKLLLIEVLSFNLLKLNYQGRYLNDIVYLDPSDAELANLGTTGSLLDFKRKKQVLLPTLNELYNRIFGPTFPGIFDRHSRTYLLSYPGIAFKFHIGLEELLSLIGENESKNDILSKLTNWARQSDISCLALAIFKGDDYASFYSNLPSNVVNNDDSRHISSASDLSIEKVIVTLSTGCAEIRFHNDNNTPPAVIEIGKSSQQDVLRILGPPDAYFNKFDSRLLIHKHLSSSSVSDLDSGSVSKFHNYFRHGIDLLYDLNPPNQKKGILQKIILRNGGIIKTLEFMQWNKCNWVVKTRPQHDAPSVNSGLYFHQFDNAFLDEMNTEKSEPVLLNRNEIEFSRDDDLEVVLSDELQQIVVMAAVNLTDMDESKTLGQLKLYGYDRCIWEVVESNDCLSCVIIY